MDSEGFITLEEAAMLPCPYQSAYTELPFDAEFLAGAAGSGALEHRYQDGVIMTRQEWVQQWGQHPLVSYMGAYSTAIHNIQPLTARDGIPTPYEGIKEAIRRLPPSGGGQREVEAKLAALPGPTTGGADAKHPARRSDLWAYPTPKEIEARVRALLKTPHIIRATVKDAFPSHNKGYEPLRVAWALRHGRDPSTLDKLPPTYRGTWAEQADILRRYGIEWGDEQATRMWFKQLRRAANDQYAYTLEASLDDPHKLEHLWGFGIPNPPKGRVTDKREWIVTPQEEAALYIPEVRRQLLAYSRQSEPYRPEGKATRSTPYKNLDKRKRAE